MYSNNPYPQSSIDPRTKPIRPVQPLPTWSEPKPKRRCGCCLLFLIIPMVMVLGLVFWVFLTFSGRTNVLLLGIDSRENSNLGRSDTNILVTFLPSESYIGMLSIPRDLWVTIPNYGTNRINTAHFFAEADQPGTGPITAMETVRTNFGVDVHYYVRLHHLGFLELVDALGGIDVTLPHPMSGYDAGTHHLNGEQALALVRDRAGSDDFSRMERGQIFITAVVKDLLSPSGWSQILPSLQILFQYLDTDIPLQKLPTLAFTLLRVGTDGIDSRIIDRTMVTPFTSEGGASVLAPNWERINPVLLEMFGQ